MSLGIGFFRFVGSLLVVFVLVIGPVGDEVDLGVRPAQLLLPCDGGLSPEPLPPHSVCGARSCSATTSRRSR